MGRERKCILCHIVYNSKQEMDEHMRSMLHHRELENLKGRDCDHECRVCRVSVVGLTEYASHISSTLHKQRVEAQEQESAGEDPEEEYFDKELVELIERRKELIRKEEEAAKQEERQKQQHQRYEERQRLQQHRGPQDWGSPRFPPPPRGRGMSNWQGNGPGWNPARAHKGGVWNPDDGSRNWYPSQQSRSATWHAEGPPNFPNWHSEQREGGSLGTGGVWGTKWQGYQGFPPNQRGQPSWSNSGSDNNLNWGSQYYWEHTKEPLLEGVESQLQIDFADDQLPLSGAIHFNKGGEGHLQIHQDHAKGNLSQKASQSKERSLGESSRAKERTTKNSSNTPKDKVNRWAPYPPAKLGEIPTQKKANISLSENYPPVPQMQVKDRELNLNLAQGATRLQRLSQKEQEENHQSSPSPRTEQGEEREHRKSGSSSRRDSQTLLSLSTLRAASSSEQITSRASSTSSLRPYHRASSRDLELSNSSKPPSASSGSPQNDRPDLEDQQSVEILGKAKDLAQNKRNLSTAHHTMETVLHIVEDQEAERMSSTTRMDREEKPRKERGSPKNKNPDRTRSHFFREEAFRQSDVPTDTLSLQSIQVSTSTLETLGSAVCSVREEEDKENDRDQLEENEAARQVMQAVDEGLDLDSDLPEDNQDEPRSVGAVPDLRKLGLPASLKRDLTRHMSSKTKAGAHEPNLNIARRFRNVSGTRKSDLEKDSGLKPTLRQLISCSASRRNVNWDQVYQEISKKKQEQGKGMPRFGIEMVTQLNYDHEVGSQEEEEDVPLTEGFQWESLCETQSVFGTATPRKRSLSESSLATDRAAAALSIFKASKPLVDPPSDHPCGQSIERVNRITIPGHVDLETQKEGQGSIKLKDDPDGHQRVIRGPDSVDGDSSCTSGAEQNDMHGAGKKRRAAGEIPSPEIPSLERKNKRRKIKPKKERSPVDQLLAVSLREEELSSSLQAVDSGLIQARATLQAAYMEVQRLLVVKQQVSMEMSSLRSKRIALLQGMQEGYEDIAQPGTKNSAEASATATTASTLHSPFSPLTDTPACSPSLPCPSTPPHFPYRAVPPSSLSPSHPTPATTASLNIKKEPLSPTSMHTDPAGRPLTDQHRKTLEPHCTTSDTVPTQSTCGSPSGLKAEPHKISHDSHGSVHVSSEPRQDSSSVSKISASDHMELGETPATRASQQISMQAEFQPPPSSSLPEPKSGKRVRRLKKKKVLRKALGNEHLDNSDTEQDGEASIRPVRRIKSKRKAKAPQVSTSIPVTMGEEHAGDKEMREGPGKASPCSKPKQEKEPAGSDSSLEAVELPQVTPTEVISIDLTDSEGIVDIRASAVRKSPVTLRDPTPIGMEKLEPQKLAFDEVSSTSELGPSTRSKDHISKTQQPLSSLNISKNSLDMSSEQGDEEEPTEGTFEGHQAAVNSMQIHSGLLYTCSGDRTVRAFNLVSRKCVAVFEGHNTKVNCLQVSSGPGLQQRLYTGASDQTIRCYSLKTRECLEQFSLSDRVLCLHSRWKVLYAGLGNGSVVSFSLKTNRQLDVFECHGPRAVSCLASAQEGARRLLLVGSYDCTISVRDAKNGVLLRTLEGHAKTVLCMKVVNDLVFSGSSDQCIHAYNIHTGELVRIYKGHSHAVTVVNIVGKVMITACLDKLVRVYELQSQDRLQVYGGHKDMVMCMAVHKGMIYTGCYDGSVQAFKLNLIQKYRCWWHGCSMVFGVMGHLQQHLLTDHTSPKFQTLKCRWKSCDALFTVRNNSKQDVPKHMQKHAEEESKLEG